VECWEQVLPQAIRRKRPRTQLRQYRAAVAPVGRGNRRNAVAEKPAAPTTERGNRTREHLKEATARVLERVGYRAMRLADIAAEANVTVSLFYHYFSSKADITHEILAELLDRNIAQTKISRPANRDPFDTIVNANIVSVELYASAPGLMRCLLHFDEEATEFSKLYRRVSLDWNRRVAGDLARRCPGSSLTEEQRLMVAYSLGAMLDNFLFEMYVDRNPLLLQAFRDTREVALFLAILWYRQIYLSNPPAEKLGRFRGFVEG